MEDKTNKDNPSGEAATGDQHGTTNTVSTGIGSVSQISGGTFNFYGSSPLPPNIASNSQSGAQSSQPTNTFTLNQKLAGSLDELSMRNICEYINATATFRVGASYDDLHGDGPSARIHSLITFCQQRKVLTLLIDGINTVRPDLLGNSYSQWQSWAAIQDAK